MTTQQEYLANIIQLLASTPDIHAMGEMPTELSIRMGNVEANRQMTENLSQAISYEIVRQVECNINFSVVSVENNKTFSKYQMDFFVMSQSQMTTLCKLVNTLCFMAGVDYKKIRGEMQ